MEIRASVWAVILLATMILPSVHAHVNTIVSPPAYSYNLVCDSPSSLLPSDGTCTRYYHVPAGAQHVHTVFVFPIGFVGTLQLNVQERVPIVGDYLTWYHYGCTSQAPYNAQAPLLFACLGGQLRDWHANELHKWQASGDAVACAPALCGWRVATSWY